MYTCTRCKEDTIIESAPAPEVKSAPAPEVKSALAPEVKSAPTPEVESAPAPEIQFIESQVESIFLIFNHASQ